jgi:hypothetical protein
MDLKKHNMPEQKTYPYEEGKNYWVRKGDKWSVAKFAIITESWVGFYETGTEQSEDPEYFDEIIPEPIAEPK